MLTLPFAAAQAPDWNDAVAKACEHRRYGMRRAVSKQIAEAGDAAVPAVRAYAEAKGASGIPLLLVDALAQAGTRGEAVVALLEEWARDRDFYWRAQALGGLALRRLERLHPLYLEAVRDPSHLFRIEGARGLHLLDPERDRAAVDALITGDPDPRVRIRVAALSVESGDHRFAAVLVGALGLSAEFLGDPWGTREAARALQALRPVVGDAVLAQGAPAGPDAQQACREALRAPAEAWREPAFEAVQRGFAGGLGIRSCRNGDLFLRWTDTGEVFDGLLPQDGVKLSQPAWAELGPGLRELGAVEPAVHGSVICDYLELVCGDEPRRVKCAPGALPSAIQRWLARLAAALRATPTPDLADDLAERLEQFAAPADK